MPDPKFLSDAEIEKINHDAGFISQEHEDRSCPKCTRAISIRDGAEAIGPCDECAQGMLDTIPSLLSHIAALEKLVERQNHALSVSTPNRWTTKEKTMPKGDYIDARHAYSEYQKARKG